MFLKLDELKTDTYYDIIDAGLILHRDVCFAGAMWAADEGTVVFFETRGGEPVRLYEWEMKYLTFRPAVDNGDGCPSCGGKVTFIRCALVCQKCGVVGGF